MADEALRHAVDDPRVLEAAVGEEQPRPDRADALEPRPAHHLAQPSRVDHLDVVVQEQQHLLIDHRRGRVVDRREAESLVAVGDAEDPVRHRIEIGESGRVVAPIVEDVDPVILIGRLRQRVDGQLEPRPMVAAGDEDRHRRAVVGHYRLEDRATRLGGPVDLPHLAGDAAAVERLFHGASAGLEASRLAVARHRRRAGHHPPVVEDLRHVADAARPL